MPYVNVDVDVDDFYDDMSRWEKQTMAEMLEQDGFCTVKQDDDNIDTDFVIENPNVHDMEWIEQIQKLFHGRLQLSNEDAELIKTIANKL